MRQRPFLKAEWTKLLLLSFRVPPEVIGRLAPPGTEPDLLDGQAYASVVGFLFGNGRLFGLRMPGSGLFGEVNLRFYVRREAAGEIRRGVVFVQEMVPRPVVAATARWLYNQNFVMRRMRVDHAADGRSLATGDTVGYQWRTGRGARRRWNCMSGRVAAPLQLPAPGSWEEFIIDHVWAYGVGRDGATREYRVERPPWRIAPASEVTWNCDVAATWDSPLARHVATQPVMTMIADGSPVRVLRGRRLTLAPSEVAAPRGAQRPREVGYAPTS